MFGLLKRLEHLDSSECLEDFDFHHLSSTYRLIINKPPDTTDYEIINVKMMKHF